MQSCFKTNQLHQFFPDGFNGTMSPCGVCWASCLLASFLECFFGELQLFIATPSFFPSFSSLGSILPPCLPQGCDNDCQSTLSDRLFRYLAKLKSLATGKGASGSFPQLLGSLSVIRGSRMTTLCQLRILWRRALFWAC